MISAVQVPTLVHHVGVAPGTITMTLPPATHRRRRVYSPYASEADMKGLGIIDPNSSFMTGRPYGPPGTATIRLPSGIAPAQVLSGAMGIIDPNSSFMTGRRYGQPGTTTIHLPAGMAPARLMGAALGIIPYPAEIARSTGSSALIFGMQPTERDLAKIYGYWPVKTGWIETANGSIDITQEQMSFGGVRFGDASSDAVDALTRIQKWQLALQAVSVLAVSAIAGVALWKAFKDR